MSPRWSTFCSSHVLHLDEPKCLSHPIQGISQMNIDFSPSFTVSYVCFVLDLQQSVSHLHRLSSVDWVNESVCASLYSGGRGTVCSHIWASKPWRLLDPRRIRLCVVLLCRIPNLSNNDNRLIENPEKVWQEMKNWTVFFIFNNTREMKWHTAYRELEKKKKLGWSFEWWMPHFMHLRPRHQEIWNLENFHMYPKDILNAPKTWIQTFQVWPHLLSLVVQNSQTCFLRFSSELILYLLTVSKRSLWIEPQKFLYGQRRQIVDKGRWAWQLASPPPPPR